MTRTPCFISLALLFVAASVVGQTPSFLEETNDPKNPLFIPTVKWLPEPLPVKDSAATCEAEMKPYSEQIMGAGLTFDMVPIRGGEFLMGSPADGPRAKKDEGPQHRVRIEPFWMGKYEVTWAEFDFYSQDLGPEFRGMKKRQASQWEQAADAISRPSFAPVGDPRYDSTAGNSAVRPAIGMTQFAAKLYCKWLSAMTGRFYRLPTEAEWEYACRAGTTSAYSFGDDVSRLNEYAWFWEGEPIGPQVVGQKKPNPWGLYDMHGNVAEWCLDQYSAEFYQRFQDQVVTGPLAVPRTMYPNVVRGGSWDDGPGRLRSAARGSSTLDWSAQDPQIPQSLSYHAYVYHVGFRVVRPLKLPDESVATSFEITPEDALRFRERYGKTHLPLRELGDLPQEKRQPRCLYTDIRPSKNGE